ncbi:MAG TPA: hypothetical protein PKV21_02410 [bacterium]|nr:hypothetical protein [bacterium]HOM26343.1 hypothetical protein [bacterium]
MRKTIFYISLIFLTGCVFQKKEKTFLDAVYREEYIKNNPDLKEEWKQSIIKGEIPPGMEKGEVEKILGKNHQTFISKTNLMEVWIYDKYYVGFDRNGKVIKFGIFEKEEGEK